MMAADTSQRAIVGSEVRQLLDDIRVLEHTARDVTGLVSTRHQAIRSLVKDLVVAANRRDAPGSGLAHFDLYPMDPGSLGLLHALLDVGQVKRLAADGIDSAEAVLDTIGDRQERAGRAAGRLRYAVQGRQNKGDAQVAIADLLRLREWARAQKVISYLRGYLNPPKPSITSTDLWEQFGRHQGWFLEQLPRARGDLAGDLAVLDTADVANACVLYAALATVAAHLPGARDQVVTCFFAARDAKVAADLSLMPTARIRDLTSGNLRLGVLEKAGYVNVQQLASARTSHLQAIPGVGEQTAKQVVAAAHQLAKAVAEDLKFRIDLDPTNPRSTALLVALYRLDRLTAGIGQRLDVVDEVSSDLAKLHGVRVSHGGWMIVAEPGSAGSLGAAVVKWSQWMTHRGLDPSQLHIEWPVAVSPQAVWEDFSRRSSHYYALLAQLVELNTGDESGLRHLPAEVVSAIEAMTLDDAYRSVSLRGYQSFGARFAIVQGKVILGDEMGLGKTIQAIAAMAHLRASTTPDERFLVVCPASVVVNWTRELSHRSRMQVHRLHGPERGRALQLWQRRGDVGVTTYETLRSLDLPDVRLAMLVVDEAHYIKNPDTRRAQDVARVLKLSERAMFLTGTPLENRVEEFVSLLDRLQPQVARAAAQAAHRPARFRPAVAPAYLRRNQEDVLTELPPLVQSDEWEEFTPRDRRHYIDAVAAGNFMAMRRAAFAAGGQSAKLGRLREIASEAIDSGRKVIVFSYFRDVLDLVAKDLGPRCIGPLTGSVPPAARQEMIDRFTREEHFAVLISQIQAGGVGLNMQAGSVVILCEPQVKPTLESQAIARAHRMGQVRSVQVHRLLTPNCVDERMLEILDAKAKLFEEFARESDLASASPEAIDISEAELAKIVVQEEQERLANEIAERLRSPEDA